MGTLLMKSDHLDFKSKPIDWIILEIKENIEGLSQELHYLRDKVDWLILYENRPDELRDAVFKLQDIYHSLEYKKRSWASLLKKIDLDFTPQPSTTLDMLKSNAAHLHQRLMLKYKDKEPLH